jgi:hypothetical protein
MRGGRSKLDVRYLAVFFAVLLVVIAASLLRFPEWRKSPDWQTSRFRC